MADQVTLHAFSGVCKGVATLSASYFSGACVYISLSSYPALSTLDQKDRLRAFRPIYLNAGSLQQKWVWLSVSACIGSWFSSEVDDRTLWWLGSGLTLAAIVPYTIFVMLPTNHSLIDLESSTKKDDDWIRSTFTKWSKLHGVRSVVSSGVVCAMIYGLYKNL